MHKIIEGDWVKVINKHHPWFGRKCEVLSISEGCINSKNFKINTEYDLQSIDGQEHDTILTFNSNEIIKI